MWIFGDPETHKDIHTNHPQQRGCLRFPHGSCAPTDCISDDGPTLIGRDQLVAEATQHQHADDLWPSERSLSYKSDAV
jgi:hypothetical protein